MKGIKNEVFYADIRWDNLLRLASQRRIVSTDLPRFPEVRRDLAMELDRETKFRTIREIAFATEKKLLQSINLFDVYQGDKITEGKKSYAISFILQDMERTLTDKEIDAVIENLARAFEQRAGARISKQEIGFRFVKQLCMFVNPIKLNK
jgi:phenylalanyl-tRNA synthetase beta chain